MNDLTHMLFWRRPHSQTHVQQQAACKDAVHTQEGCAPDRSMDVIEGNCAMTVCTLALDGRNVCFAQQSVSDSRASISRYGHKTPCLKLNVCRNALQKNDSNSRTATQEDSNSTSSDSLRAYKCLQAPVRRPERCKHSWH